jgi:hypothetical protein
MNFAKDDFVRLPAEAGGSVGRVMEDSAAGKVRVQFPDGIRVYRMDLCNMTKIEENEETAALLQSLKAKVRKPGVMAKSLPELISIFKTVYPGGCEDKAYEKEERAEKVRAREEMQRVLGQDALKMFIEGKKYGDLAQNTLKVVRATHLLSPFESIALVNAFKAEASQQIFGDALYALLHGEGDEEARFTAFVAALGTIGAAKWPIATYFLFLAYPERHMFMKPEATKAVAQVCGFELHYRTVPNWLTYSRLTQLADILFKALTEADLRPKDRIDIQCFIAAAARLDKKEYRPSQAKV